MGRMAGRYTTKRDGVTYTYEATWQAASDGVVWSATVKRDGVVAGTPNGHIQNPAREDQLADDVRRLLESWIEKRADR